MPCSAALFVALLAMACTPRVAFAACAAQSGARQVPLVELYTSEGCSSCPPADRWLSQRYRNGDANYLAFHVDYWNDDGWRDRFSSHAYTQRQRQRVATTGSRVVYTPQVMVGRRVQAQWSAGDDAWRRTLQEAAAPPGAGLALRMQPDATGWRATVAATPAGSRGQGAQLWIARHVDAQSTQVRAGENGGATLHHDRVVLQLLGPWTLADATLVESVALPASIGRWGVTAFVQARNGDVLQSLDLDVGACSARR